jgi:hypothetical protein
MSELEIALRLEGKQHYNHVHLLSVHRDGDFGKLPEVIRGQSSKY